MNSLVAGIDIGGSHISAALIDLNKRKIIEETCCRSAINSNGSLQQIILEWAAAIKNCLQFFNGQSVSIGIAMPGPFDYENGISYIKNQDKYEALYKVNVKDALAKELGVNSNNIRFENDAACFLKGEAFSGVAKDCTTAYGITLGTGLGSSKYKSGEAKDANFWCLPFKKGIAEDYLSTRWFVKRYYEKTSKQIENVKALAALHGHNDLVAEIFEEFGRNLADFLKKITLQEKPELVVFGGNISETFTFFYPALKNRLSEIGLDIIIKKSILKETASLIGAASSWLIHEEVKN